MRGEGDKHEQYTLTTYYAEFSAEKLVCQITMWNKVLLNTNVQQSFMHYILKCGDPNLNMRQKVGGNSVCTRYVRGGGGGGQKCQLAAILCQDNLRSSHHNHFF